MKKIIIVLLLLNMIVGCSNKSEEINYYTYNNESINLCGETYISTSGDYSLSFVINPISNFEDNILLTVGEYELYYGDLLLETGNENYVVVNVKDGKIIVFVNGQERLNDTLPDKSKDIVLSNKSNEGYIKGLVLSNYVKSKDIVEAEYHDIYIDMLLSDIKFNDMNDVQEDFWLYPMLNDEYPIVWKSSDDSTIKPYRNHGVVTIHSVDKEVVLTATVNHNDKIYTKDFIFNVLADNDTTRLKRDSSALVNDMGYIVNDALKLPNVGCNGSLIEWAVLEGNVQIINNTLLKTESAQEKEHIVLQATLTKGEFKETLTFNLCLLDKYTGYIMTYFNGELGEETGKIAYSRDGLNWISINEGNTILSSELGNGRIRDPFISRDKDGNFIIVATQGFDNPSIYVWKTKDLISFDNSLIDVAVKDEQLNITGERAWAPEFIYVPSLDTYYVYFSDPMDEKSGSIFYVSTKDFEHVSYPKEILNVGYPIIDGTILNLNGKNWMFYKDERIGATTIFYGISDNLESGFGKVYDQRFICPIKQIEGPFVFKDINSDYNYLYVDYYSQQEFYVARFTQLGEKADFEWLNKSEYSLPIDVRHGSVIPVTESELTSILNYYN